MRPLLGLVALWLVAACATPASSQQPELDVVAVGDGNSAELAVVDGRAAVTVRSARGIGRLSLRQLGGPPPSGVELRLWLAGLEQLELRHGAATTLVSVASGRGRELRQSLRGPDGVERQLSPDDAEWLAVTRVPARAGADPPSNGDQFVVALPATMLADGALEISWIDFFR